MGIARLRRRHRGHVRDLVGIVDAHGEVRVDRTRERRDAPSAQHRSRVTLPVRLAGEPRALRVHRAPHARAVPALQRGRQQPLRDEGLLDDADLVRVRRLARRARRVELQLAQDLGVVGNGAGLHAAAKQHGLRRGGFGGLWLELKAPGKKPTPAQREWLARMERAGYHAAWADDWQKAATIIAAYLEGTVPATNTIAPPQQKGASCNEIGRAHV